MTPFLLASALFLQTPSDLISVRPLYENPELERMFDVQTSTVTELGRIANTTIEGRVIPHDSGFQIGKFLENNWVIIIGFIVFLIRLQNSVEDIKKDNQNKIELLTKDFELIKSGLNELRQQIDHTAGNAKEDVEKVSIKLKGTQRTLYKLIEFINSDRSLNSKPIFKVSKYDDDDSDV